MRNVSGAVLGFALIIMPGMLAAQTIPSPFEFVETRHSGGIFAGQLITNPGTLDLGPQSGLKIGGRYNIRLTGPLGGEVSLAFVPTQRTIYSRQAPGPDVDLVPVAETDQVLMLAEAGLRFDMTGPRTWHGFMPYAVLTGGLAVDLNRADPLEEAIPAEQRFRFGPAFAAGGGLGTDFYLSERISIRAEVRDHLWRLNHPVGLTATGGRENEWRHNFGLTLGGAFHF
jgi:hypothetical protein